MRVRELTGLRPWIFPLCLLLGSLFFGAVAAYKAPNLFSGPVIVAMLAVSVSRATPLVYGSLSGIFCERSGVTQIAIEGMMLTAAFFAFAVQVATHNIFIALGGAMLAGALMGAFHAVLSITFQVNQIISGTVVNILSIGLTGYLNRQLFLFDQAIDVTVFPQLPVPVLADLPWLGRILFSHQPLTYVALLLPLMAHVWLFHTTWGLRTRAVGEHPLAADTAGINVYSIRYLNVIVGGALAGLGGAYFTLESIPTFQPLMTNGRGFIALAAMIFGKWTPLGAWGGALLFGVAEALPVTLQIQGVTVNYFLVGLLPYVLTIIVLAGAVGRASPPAAIGLPYDRR
ncbi:MAG: transporter permease [Bacteroidetes bacterium]|nr:transporter permease [Bacteroidota bacterium]MBM2827170.1 transporter permease [Dehalococcoidia bacterium]